MGMVDVGSQRPIILTVRPAVFDCDVLTFDMASIFETWRNAQRCEPVSGDVLLRLLLLDHLVGAREELQGSPHSSSSRRRKLPRSRAVRPAAAPPRRLSSWFGSCRPCEPVLQRRGAHRISRKRSVQ
jgi:hypothetical protein